MLPREQSEILQRVQLVAVETGAVRETAENLVPPFRGKPWLGRGIREFLELPARSAHVGRCAEDDGVGGIERCPTVFREVALSIDRMERGSGSQSVRQGATPAEAIIDIAKAYLDFAFESPALYEAMFVLPSGLRFAKSDTPQVLRSTFGAMIAVVEPFCADTEVATETFWAALHGLAELERHGRIRATHRKERLRLMVTMFAKRE